SLAGRGGAPALSLAGRGGAPAVSFAGRGGAAALSPALSLAGRGGAPAFSFAERGGAPAFSLAGRGGAPAFSLAGRGGAVAGRGASFSPGARMTAIAWPTAMSSPSEAVTAASVPLAGASISTVALSVSTSMSGSPCVTVEPSLFSQRMSLPVSWAMPRAGMTTSVAIGFCPRALAPRGPRDPAAAFAVHMVVEVGLGLSRGRQLTAGGVVPPAHDEQLLGWEARDDLGAVFRHDELLLDPCRGPSVSGGPESFEGENHVLLDHLRVLE